MMLSLLGSIGRFQNLWLILFVISTPLLLNGCGDDKTSQIDWQLPLAAPNDPHGVSVNQMLPPWAELQTGSAELVLLQKGTARLFTVKLESGQQVDFQDMHFRLLGLADGLRMKSGSYIEDKNVHNPAAFVEVSREGRQIYRGWLYQEFPELFGPDMEDWKLWLRGLVISQDATQQDGVVSETITGTRP